MFSSTTSKERVYQGSHIVNGYDRHLVVCRRHGDDGRKTREALQHNVEAMSVALTRWSLKVNWKKSKVMRVEVGNDWC